MRKLIMTLEAKQVIAVATQHTAPTVRELYASARAALEAPPPEELQTAINTAANAAVHASELRRKATTATGAAGVEAARLAAEATAEAERFGEVAAQLAELDRRARLLAERLVLDRKFIENEAARIRQHIEDVDLPEGLRRLYLDQTILNNDEVKQLFGVSIQAVWDWAAPTPAERRPRPHPRISPEPDVALRYVAQRAVPGVQLGKIVEWGIWSHRLLWDAETGTVRKNPNFSRHGRARARK